MDQIDIPNASVFLMEYPGQSLFEPLLADTPWRQRAMMMYGRQVKQPRLTSWYGDESAEYTYSGIRNIPLPWTETLLEAKHLVESLLEVSFNGVLLNYYRDGQDSIGFHADDEPQLGKEPIVASVSFGAERFITFRDRAGVEADVNVLLRDRSLLVMIGDTQKNWYHGINKVKKCDPRINLTFRQIINI